MNCCVMLIGQFHYKVLIPAYGQYIAADQSAALHKII